MRNSLHKILLAPLLLFALSTQAQQLQKVCPISVKSGSLPDSVSFFMTVADYDFFRGRKMHYAPALEIVDADAPFPPRWYALHPGDTAADFTTSWMVMIDAAVKDSGFSFFTILNSASGKKNMSIAYCGKDMAIRDTFYKEGGELDCHDFILAPHGEVVYFLAHEQMVDLRKAYNNEEDSAVKMVYETIEISDSTGKSVFSWDPLKRLGFDAVYLPYRYALGTMSDHRRYEWSHGNALKFDYDGNILYSFKHIGIGKISRADGHVIWRIDRKNQKINAQSDEIPVYLQHDLNCAKDENGNEYYTVVSNGDDDHQHCVAYKFTVSFDSKGVPLVKLLGTIQPAEPIPNTGGGGNFDPEINGNYLFNYGLFKWDTTQSQRTLFEYRDEKNHSTVLYKIPASLFSYKIHKVSAQWRPARPLVSLTAGRLSTDPKWREARWYKLSGPDHQTVEPLGKGQAIKPDQEGYYCVAARYGMGWVVSRPFHYLKK